MFEDKLNTISQVEFLPSSQNFLGLKIRTRTEDNDMSIFLSQQATTEILIHVAGLTYISATTNLYLIDLAIQWTKSSAMNVIYHNILK